MVKKQEQAANEYARQARRMDELADKIKEHSSTLFDAIGPDEVTWVDVEMLIELNTRLEYVISFIENDEE